MVPIGAGVRDDIILDAVRVIGGDGAKLMALQYTGITALLHSRKAEDRSTEFWYEARDASGCLIPWDEVDREMSALEPLYLRVCERAARRAARLRLAAEASEEIRFSAGLMNLNDKIVIKIMKGCLDYRDRLLGRAYCRFHAG